MGGIIGGIGKLFGGSSAKTDRAQTLNSYGELNNLYNYGLNQAKEEQAAGSDLTGQAGAYFSKLLSGNRTAALGAVAPVANAATSAADAEKRNLATTGTGRGGGVNTTGQQIDTNRQAQVDSALNAVEPGAATGAAGVGGTELSDASRLLGLSDTAADQTLTGSISSRPISFGIHNATADTAGNLTNQTLAAIFDPSGYAANQEKQGGGGGNG